MVLLMSAMSTSVYAANDLSDLDAMLGDNTDTTWDASVSEIQDTATTWDLAVSKIELSLTGDITNSYITLQFNKVWDYTDYKIYYSKDGDNSLSEQKVELSGNETMKATTVTGLEAETKYNFVAKAFDSDGNPIETTTSDSLSVTTKAEQHAAPADNIIYNPVVKTVGNKITVSYKPGVDVKKIQISVSEDGKTFKPVATIDATITSYIINATKTGKKYIKLVPIAEDGTLWICKVWTTEVPFVTVTVEPKKIAKKVMWKPKTGPETYLLIILVILAYIAYAIKKQRA